MRARRPQSFVVERLVTQRLVLGGLLAGSGQYGQLFSISAGLFLPLTVVSAATRRRYLRTRRGR